MKFWLIAPSKSPESQRFYTIDALLVSMAWNATEIGVALGESISWLSGIIGIVGSMLAIISARYWFRDRKNARKATLYFPLYLACRGIIDLVKDNNAVGVDRSKDLLASCARTLDDIVYTHGSIIHLKEVCDLNNFIDMKKAVDETLGFVEGGRSRDELETKFASPEFKKVKNYAESLLLKCKEEVKILRELP